MLIYLFVMLKRLNSGLNFIYPPLTMLPTYCKCSFGCSILLPIGVDRSIWLVLCRSPALLSEIISFDFHLMCQAPMYRYHLSRLLSRASDYSSWEKFAKDLVLPCSTLWYFWRYARSAAFAIRCTVVWFDELNDLTWENISMDLQKLLYKKISINLMN